LTATRIPVNHPRRNPGNQAPLLIGSKQRLDVLDGLFSLFSTQMGNAQQRTPSQLQDPL